MIEKDFFDTIASLYNERKDKISSNDILHSLVEELGEYSRAVRVEDKFVLCGHKKVSEHSSIEIIDLILVAIEALISRGMNYEEIRPTALKKLDKWKNLLGKSWIG